MAKQVKVFDVTAGTTATTVYTVPAGRVAKVVITKYSSSGSFKVGGYEYGRGSAPTNLVSQVSDDWTISITETYVVTQGDGFTTSTVYGTRASARVRTHFLPEGSTVTMLNASAQFCVVEEF